MRARDTRRTFLAAAGAGLFTVGARTARAEPKPRAADVAAVEDLMREHGVLRRVLLVYEDLLRRLDGPEPLRLEWLSGGTGIIRRFIEDYHEKDEEELVFPRFEKAGQQLELVRVLRAQHQAGRRLTDEVTRLSAAAVRAGAPERRPLAAALRSFIRMYRPHAAREDTVLFPALRPLIGERAYEQLGDRFEEREHATFGGDGFEKMVGEVAALEAQLGLADLAQFTPR